MQLVAAFEVASAKVVCDQPDDARSLV
jgi:hypothetical protein